MDNSLPRYGWFYGEVQKRVELPFLTLTEVSYSPGFEVPVHRHENPWFGFVLEGTLIETYRNSTARVQPMSVMFRVAGENHSDRGGERGARSLVLDLKGPLFASLTQEFGVLKNSAEFCGGALPAIMFRIHKEFNANDSLVALSLQGLLFELIAESHRRIVPKSPRAPLWLEQAVELFRARFTEPLELSQVAAEVGIHPVHLARTFRKFSGSSIGEYIRRLRIESSYDQLLQTEIPIVQLAVQLGFCDQAHFCRTFKRITGMNPTDLRNSIGNSRARSKRPLYKQTMAS